MSFIFLTRSLFAGLALAVMLAGCSGDKGGNAHDVVDLRDLAPMSGTEPMMFFGPGRLPLKPPVVSQIKYEYYECDGLVSGWFLKLLQAEMKFLEKQSDMKVVSGEACAVSRAINQGQAEPRYTVHLFDSRKQANDCVVNSLCELARNVTLVPRDNAVWRSYFLTDFEMKRYFVHCLAPPQKWHQLVSCDVVN
jgi:hypothetical protein